MGVSGCGKTTVGQKLAARLRLPFFDGDDFHTPANKTKMAVGIALTDTDRVAWLETLSVLLEQQVCVLACSALKEKYRTQLARGAAITWVYLQGNQELIAQRLKNREHFFDPNLLESQFKILEEPTDALIFNVASSVEQIIDNVMQVLKG